MDSLPPQPLDSLPVPNRKEAFEKLAHLCFARSKYPDLSEEKLAKCAGFASAETMRISLENWGLLALLPVEEKGARKITHASLDKPKTRRNPPPSKEAGRKLPALSNATTLFRDTINTLADYVERLQYHKVVLRDGRFVATDEIPKEVEMYPIMYIRDEYSAERWEEICALHDKDPESTTVVHVYQDESWAKGATHYPPWFETCLITAVLMQAPEWVERLLQKIHPEPAHAPREQIRKLLFGRPGKGDGLYPAARQLARLIRGAEVGEGRLRTTLHPWTQASVQALKEGREKGLTDERIRQTLAVDEKEFARLEKLL